MNVYCSRAAVMRSIVFCWSYRDLCK